MAKKIYAVKCGKRPGIYETWEECQKQVIGYPGAVYKGFATKEEAKMFLGMDGQQGIETKETQAIAYVDGSYNVKTNEFSYGMVLLLNDREIYFAEKFCDRELAEMNNVAGEIKGAEAAMQYCLENNIQSITIYHDYEGVAKWCNGDWQAKKEGTIAYMKFYQETSSKVRIIFKKVKAHSGDKYNELADNLAKKALGIDCTNTIKMEDELVAKKGIYIDREGIVRLIREVGNEQWEDFSASELFTVGNAQRCVLTADGKVAMLNFFFNNDGSTTITTTGKNVDISSTIKSMLEKQCQYSNVAQGRTYSIKKLPEEWKEKLIKYLSSLEDVAIEENNVETVPIHRSYTFSSKIGDKLTINIYQTGTVTLQGKPAYLYGEAISFLSYCKNVSVEDIVDSINSFHNVNVKTSEVKNEMEVLMPRAYGNIDEMILKLLSPSISLRKVNIELEDYSCYTFPALRALEGYIKYLFGLKGITVGHNFGSVFNGDNLLKTCTGKIADAVYQNELERLYRYFKSNRHVIFHADQILIGTKVIEDKHEADEIINTVINLIETSYSNIFR